jgi:hypothetical protein
MTARNNDGMIFNTVYIVVVEATHRGCGGACYTTAYFNSGSISKMN